MILVQIAFTSRNRIMSVDKAGAYKIELARVESLRGRIAKAADAMVTAGDFSGIVQRQ
jgi:hypothetical protein